MTPHGGPSRENPCPVPQLGGSGRTFAPGPPSGTLLGPAPINGVPVPFEGQPVQGFSATLPAGHGRLWVMTDNGYGAIENSADFNLRVYLIKPNVETARGGPGTTS